MCPSHRVIAGAALPCNAAEEVARKSGQGCDFARPGHGAGELLVWHGFAPALDVAWWILERIAKFEATWGGWNFGRLKWLRSTNEDTAQRVPTSEGQRLRMANFRVLWR